MKDFLLVSQEREGYCICSVLQAIFGNYDISVSQEEVANNLTPSENGFHVDDNSMRKFVRSRNLSYEFYWSDEIPLNDPDLILFQMQDHSGFVGINGHIYLFEDYSSSRVELRDPKDGKVVVYDVNDMTRKMNELERGCFGLIRN